MSDDSISRQAAIDLLDNLIGMVDDNHGSDYDAALRMGIEALKAEEPEPSDVARDIATIIENEKDMRVIAEPRKGKWILKERREPVYDIFGIKTWGIAYECSECGFIHTVIENFGHYSFCPNCGASMSEGEEE